MKAPTAKEIRQHMPDYTCDSIDVVHDWLRKHGHDDLADHCNVLRRENVQLRRTAITALRQLERWEKGELRRTDDYPLHVVDPAERRKPVGYEVNRSIRALQSWTRTTWRDEVMPVERIPRAGEEPWAYAGRFTDGIVVVSCEEAGEYLMREGLP